MKNLKSGDQLTLFESWQLDEKNEQCNKSQSKKSESNATDEENITEDDIIASSQSISESKLKKNISLKSLTLKLTTLKSKKKIISDEKSRNNDSEISSNTLKEFSPKENFSSQFSKNNQNQSKCKLSLHGKKNLKKANHFEKVTFDSDNDEKDISEDILLKLKSLKVKLQHNVPPQHKDEKLSVSKFLTSKEVDLFETYGPLKRGSYTEVEDKIIKKNWLDFCKVHNWDSNFVKPFLSMRYNRKYYIPNVTNRKNFIRFLANGLPWRSLHSVYTRFRNLYSITKKQGKYSSKEDKMILFHMESANETEEKCAKLAKLLKRKRHSIWQRYQKLKNNSFTLLKDANSDCSMEQSNTKKRKTCLDDYNCTINHKEDHKDSKIEETDNEKYETSKKFKFNDSNSENLAADNINKEADSVIWNFETVGKFINLLIQITSSSEILDLKNKIFDHNIWNEMEKKMNIKSSILKNFWYFQLHMQIFCPQVTKLNNLKIKLIELLYEKKITVDKDIQWNDVVLSFDGLTTDFLSKLFDNLRYYAQNKMNSSQLTDILDYLYHNHITELKKDSIDVVLPKLYYKYGRVICLDKGIKNKIPFKKSHNPLNEEI